MQRCMPDSRDSIVPGQFSFSPGFDAELPAVPAPQRANAAPAPVAHIDKPKAAGVSMESMCLKKDRNTTGEQTESA